MGSNPTIYRILSKIQIINNSTDAHYKVEIKNAIKSVITYKYLLTFWASTPSHYITEVPHTLNFINTNKHTDNINTKESNKVSNIKLPNQAVFTTYISMSISIYSGSFKVHPSFNSFYIKRRRYNSSTINLSKFFHNWISVSAHLYETLSYKVKPTFFGTTFFKNEIHTLNWLSLMDSSGGFRLSKTMLFVTPMERSVDNDSVIQLIIKKGITNSLVFDTTYHQKTIDYLHKGVVFTVGTVPVTYDSKTLDFSIPISSDSLFSQLFMIKLVNKFIKHIEYVNYFKWENGYDIDN